MSRSEIENVISPILAKQIKRCEGYDIFEELDSPEGDVKPFSVYICAPLQPTTNKSAFRHLIEAMIAASLIEGAKYKGKKVSCFIPHIHIFPDHNELVVPKRRQAGIKLNNIMLENCDALILLGTRRSAGMKAEVDEANRLGLPIILFHQFKKKLTNLPSSDQIEATALRYINRFPTGRNEVDRLMATKPWVKK